MHVDADHENPLPNKMPAFGFAAVPSPTNNRNTAPGYHPATGEPTADPDAAPSDTGATGSPEDTCPAGATARDRAPNSRRLAAATAHTNGPAAGPSPDPPEANHANTSSLRPCTPPGAATRAGALIIGADTTAGRATSTTPAEPPINATGESTTGATESTTESTTECAGDRSAEPALTPDASTTPDTTEPGRG